MDAFNQAVLVDQQGRPLRPAQTEQCPRCGAGVDKRVPSSGFGLPHPVCAGGCSPAYEWTEEVWRG